MFHWSGGKYLIECVLDIFWLLSVVCVLHMSVVWRGFWLRVGLLRHLCFNVCLVLWSVWCMVYCGFFGLCVMYCVAL